MQQSQGLARLLTHAIIHHLPKTDPRCSAVSLRQLSYLYSFSPPSTEQSVQRGLTLNMYHKTCFGGHYIPIVQFRFEGQPPPPIYTPKTGFWGHLKLKSMESVFTYISTTDKAIITKLYRNIKQVKYYITV